MNNRRMLCMVKGHSRKPVPTAFGNITIDGVKDGQYSGDLARISSCTHTHTNTLTQIDWLFIYKPHGYGYPKLCTNNRSLITAQWMCVATIFTSNFYLALSLSVPFYPVHTWNRCFHPSVLRQTAQKERATMVLTSQ